LVIEEEVMHRPEFSLGAGRFGYFSRLLSEGMFRGQRKMPEDIAEPIL
jgi:hypothetical protein